MPQLVDGRHARRQRNRDAVVDALLQLYKEGNLEPTTDQVAQRSGLSARSLFRYFEDVDDLYQAAITQHLNSLAGLSALPPPSEAPLPERARTIAEMRARLHAEIGAVGRAARIKAPFIPVLSNMLRGRRREVRATLAAWFAPELSQMDPAAAATTLSAIDVLCSFESWDLMTVDHLLDTDEIRAVMERGILALLSAH